MKIKLAILNAANVETSHFCQKSSVTAATILQKSDKSISVTLKRI